jgi:hypothetical protein
VLQAKAHAHREFDARSLIGAAEEIRGQLSDDAPPRRGGYADG